MQDSPISFPGLFGDWEFTAGSVAIHLGHGIYWYGIILALGVLAGLLLCTRQAKRFGLTGDDVTDVVLWGVPVGIVGARVYYVIFYLDLYRIEGGGFDWGRMLAVWDGGLAIYGTVIAAFALALVFCRRRKIKMGALTDLCVMGLLLGQAIGRWGNFMNREAFGAETTAPWRMRLWQSAYSYVEVHPTFLYESLWNLLGLALIFFVISRARRFDGESTWFYFLWYGLGRSWIEGLRTDSLYLFDWTLMGQPIRVSQALSVVMILVSAGMLFYFIKVRKCSPEDLMVNQKARAALEAEGAGDGAEAPEQTGGAVDAAGGSAAEAEGAGDGADAAQTDEAAGAEAADPLAGEDGAAEEPAADGRDGG